MKRRSLPFLIPGLLGSLALAVPFVTCAQRVYKCVGAEKVVSYQSAPCAGNERLARQWEAVPAPARTPEQMARQREIQAQGEQESAYLRSLARRSSPGSAGPRSSGINISAARDGSRCAKAKKRRDETERRVGLNRTVEGMQRLSRMVYEACR